MILITRPQAAARYDYYQPLALNEHSFMIFKQSI